MRLEFPQNAGRGRHRRAAAERVALMFAVRPERKIIIDDDWAGRDPYGPPPWTYGERELTITGSPGLVARYCSALPAILAELERLATKAVSAYGRWLRTAPEVEYEMMPSEFRSAMRRWRCEVFDELAYIAGRALQYEPLFFPEGSWSRQGRAYAYTLPRPADLFAFVDEAEAARLEAEAFHITDPVVVYTPRPAAAWLYEDDEATTFGYAFADADTAAPPIVGDPAELAALGLVDQAAEADEVAPLEADEIAALMTGAPAPELVEAGAEAGERIACTVEEIGRYVRFLDEAPAAELVDEAAAELVEVEVLEAAAAVVAAAALEVAELVEPVAPARAEAPAGAPARRPGLSSGGRGLSVGGRRLSAVVRERPRPSPRHASPRTVLPRPTARKATPYVGV